MAFSNNKDEAEKLRTILSVAEKQLDELNLQKSKTREREQIYSKLLDVFINFSKEVPLSESYISGTFIPTVKVLSKLFNLGTDMLPLFNEGLELRAKIHKIDARDTRRKIPPTKRRIMRSQGADGSVFLLRKTKDVLDILKGAFYGESVFFLCAAKLLETEILPRLPASERSHIAETITDITFQYRTLISNIGDIEEMLPDSVESKIEGERIDNAFMELETKTFALYRRLIPFLKNLIEAEELAVKNLNKEIESTRALISEIIVAFQLAKEMRERTATAVKSASQVIRVPREMIAWRALSVSRIQEYLKRFKKAEPRVKLKVLPDSTIVFENGQGERNIKSSFGKWLFEQITTNASLAKKWDQIIKMLSGENSV